MNFQLSETQTLIADTVAGLMTDHLEARRSGKAGGASADLWAQLADLGLLGAEAEEVYGGSAGSFEDLAVILQGLGRGACGGGFIATVLIGAALISRLGDVVQKETLLPALIEGRLKLAFAHEERSGAAPHETVQMVARSATGGWTLSGRKALVFGGDTADLFIVSAMTDDGLGLFLAPADTAGLVREPFVLYDGEGAANLRFDDVALGGDARLGGAQVAQAAVDWVLDRANAGFANEAIGLMSALCDLTLEHIKTREQFGQVLGKFQVVQHRMVDMRIHLEVARSMAILAAVAADDPDETRRARDVSAAKAAISKAARAVSQSAIQLHGAIALTADYPAGGLVKRLTLIDRAFGDGAWHLTRFARYAA